MRIICTGGGGYVGSKVVGFLLNDGHEVVIVDLLKRGASGLRSDHAKCDHILRDVREIETIDFGKWPEAVVHMAAVVGEANCLIDEPEANSINIDGTIAVMRLKLPTIFFSTCSNYGIHDTLIDESAPLNPLGVYARTKVEAEKIVLRAGGTVLRLATVCGPSRNTRFDLFVNELAKAAALKRLFHVHGSDTWRPYVHVADVGLVVAYLIRKHVPPGLWNVVGENARKMDIINMAQASFKDLRLVRTKKDADKRDYRVSGDRLERELGIRPYKTVSDAFEEVATMIFSGTRRTEHERKPRHVDDDHS